MEEGGRSPGAEGTVRGGHPRDPPFGDESVKQTSILGFMDLTI